MPPDHETLLAAVRASVLAAGRRPIRLRQFLATSGFRRCDIFKYYPVWNDLLRAAGFDFQPYNQRIEERRLLADWAGVVRKLRRIPTVRDYGIHGKYSSGTFENHFGRWNHIPAAFHAFAGGSRKWKPILSLIPTPGQPDPPAAAPPRRSRPRLCRTRRSCFGRAPRLPRRPASGPPLGIPGMRNAPVNELGVIYLFGLLAPRLGFDAEAFQAAFPDCEARRKIGPDKWQSVRIEFEYESANFLEHGHDAEGCDLIVCWAHNWKDCPKNLEIIALKDEIKCLNAAATGRRLTPTARRRELRLESSRAHRFVI